MESHAKWWWASALWVRLSGFLIAVASTLLGRAPALTSYSVALLTLLAETAGYRSDWARSKAQGLRRRLDLLDSFGWAIPNAEYSDILASVPGYVHADALNRPTRGPYFASAAQPGPVRAVENVSESAWFSKHLSEEMGHLCAATIAVTGVSAIAALTAAIHSVGDAAASTSVARVVTSALMLLLSLGVVRMMAGYYAFAHAAATAEAGAERLLESGTPSEREALKLVCEYQVSRSASPLIPEWLWQWRRNALNELWRSLRRRAGP